METYDIIVIGAGPAGILSAGRAAQRGRSVLLLEKNATLGKKLLLTGGGRCNLTNKNITPENILKKYRNSGKFLFSAFAQFDVKKTLEFFEKIGIKTKEENNGRVFPTSNSAKNVLETLTKYLQKNNVEIKTNSEVTKISIDEKTKNIIIEIGGSETVSAKSCILATGGNSYPETGSTGEVFDWLEKMGHKITKNNVALAPVALSDNWPKKLTGVTLNDINITVFQDNKKKFSIDGEILFTHFGVSGPTIFNISKQVGDLLKSGKVTIKIDLLPKIKASDLQTKLQNLFQENANKQIKNNLSELIPSSVALAILEILEINAEIKNNNLTAQNRKKIISTIKALPLNVSGLIANRAMASSSGVDLAEVNFKTMQSRIIPNLYLTGDILDIDRPSGGYSLQICWTTGYIAGNNA